VDFTERKFRIFGPRLGASFGGHAGQVRGCQERVSILIFTGSGVEEFSDVGNVNHRLVGLKMNILTYWSGFNEDKRCGERRGYVRNRDASCSIPLSLCQSRSFKSTVSVS